MKDAHLWVPGWSLQAMLFVGAAIALYQGDRATVVTTLTGMMIIGTIRAIEKDRREGR